MKILIITYNCNHENISLIKHEDTLYLFNPPIKKIWNCKYVDFTSDLNDYIVKSLFKYKSQYDIICALDNQKFKDIDMGKLILFKKEIKDWLIFGNKIIRSNLESFDLNELFVNCRLLEDNDIINFLPSKEGDIEFQYISRIIYKKYDKCFENKSLGIKAKVCDNILI